MAKLVKIKNVHLHTGLSETGGDQFTAHKLLVAANVPFIVLNYGEHFVGHDATFASLNTWNWGANSEKRTFDHFPILTWDECYDDWSVQTHSAVDSANIAASTLLTNKALIANT